MKKIILLLSVCFIFISFCYSYQGMGVNRSEEGALQQSISDSTYIQQSDIEKEKKNVYLVDGELKKGFNISTFDFSTVESMEVKEDSLTRKKYNAEGNVIFIKTKKLTD